MIYKKNRFELRYSIFTTKIVFIILYNVAIFINRLYDKYKSVLLILRFSKRYNLRMTTLSDHRQFIQYGGIFFYDHENYYPSQQLSHSVQTDLS